MKQLVLVIGALLFVSADAFAIHAYHTEQCEFKNESGSFTVFRHLFDSFGWISSEKLTDATVTQLANYLDLPDGTETEIGAEGSFNLALKVTGDSNKVEKAYDDGCWQGIEGTLDRNVTVDSAEASVEGLGLKVGDALVGSCSFQSITPAGPDCAHL